VEQAAGLPFTMIALRYVGAVLIGMLVGGLVIGAIELVGMLLFPLSDNLTAEQYHAMTFDEKRELLHSVSPVAFFPVLLAYAVGMLVAGGLATILWPARKRTGAVIIAVLMIAVNAANVWITPQPPWVSIASFVIFIIATTAGALLVSRRDAAV
jgi:hypothetical protein